MDTKKLVGIVVLALLIVGGLYLWNQKSAADQAAALQAAGDQDTLEKIEANYAAIDVSNLDEGLDDLINEI